jgi:hypothetical protein
MNRLVALWRRLTRTERVVAALLALSPVVAGIVLISMLLWEGLLVVAVGVFVYFVIVAALVISAFRARLRLRKKFLDQPVALPVLHPRELERRGILADVPPAWALLQSPWLEQRRIVRQMAYLSPRALLFFGLRSKSEWAREPLTYLASGGAYSYKTLETLVLATSEESSRAGELLGDIDADRLLSVARLVASQNIRPRDAQFAFAALKYVASRLGATQVSAGNLRHLAERLIQAGDFDEAAKIVRTFRGAGLTERLLRADLLNPFHTSTRQGAQEIWLAAFNLIYEPYGLEPVRLSDEGATPYDRMESDGGEQVFDGPLVTVIMTCFKPDHTLLSSVRSMIGQSWQNWELIVADDASPLEYQSYIDEVASLDSRIRVLRAKVNGGTYVRRNEAIIAAAGDFVTMHDSDDWAHPRRLELQMRHLLANPSCIANVSHSLRVSEDLMFVQSRGATMRLTESSLLFRKQVVLDKIGYFDSVRKAGDSEFRLRIEAAFSTSVPTIDTLSPLALVRYAPESLSGSDLGDGWMHPARVAYRSAVSRWHADIRSGAAEPFMSFPLVERPFPVHPYLLGRTFPHREFDILVVVDAREDVQSEEELGGLVRELEGLAAQSARVGLLQVETLVEGRPSVLIAPRVQRLIDTGRIDLVLLSDDVHASVVVVRNAYILQAAPSTSSGIGSDRAVVFEESGSARDIAGLGFATADVDDAVLRLFGAEPEWRLRDSLIDYSFAFQQEVANSEGRATVADTSDLGY